VQALGGYGVFQFWRMGVKFGAPVLMQSAVKGLGWAFGLVIALWAVHGLWQTRRAGAFLLVILAAHGLVGRIGRWVMMASYGGLDEQIVGPMLASDLVALVGWGASLGVVLWGPGRRELLLDSTLRGRFLIRAGAIGMVWALVDVAAPALIAVLGLAGWR